MNKIVFKESIKQKNGIIFSCCWLFCIIKNHFSPKSSGSVFLNSGPHVNKKVLSGNITEKILKRWFSAEAGNV